MAGAVAGREDHVQRQPRELQGLSPADQLVRVVALERPEARVGDEGHDVGEDRRLDLGAVDRGFGRGGDRRHGADVVEVAVGDENRLDAGSGLLDGGEDPLGLVAGVDDQQAIGALTPE